MTLVALACGFAFVGITQLWTGSLYFAPDLEVSNAYTSYLRTTSIFSDASIYGRQLAVAIVVLVSVLWVARISLWAAGALITFLWVGLYFVLAVEHGRACGVGAGSRPRGRKPSRPAHPRARCRRSGNCGDRRHLVTVRGDSAQRATSGRTALIEDTWRVFAANPIAGVGLGSQPEAARDEGGARAKDKNASHTTPLTVAAELGVLGLAAYVALLFGGAALLLAVFRNDRALGLALGVRLPCPLRPFAVLRRLLRGSLDVGNPRRCRRVRDGDAGAGGHSGATRPPERSVRGGR